MKFNPKKDISPKYLFLALSVICIILLGLSLFSDSLVLKLPETFGNFIAPMQDGVSGIGYDKPLLEVLENEELEDQIAKNQAELTELAELRALYQLDQMYPDYNTTAARIFSVENTGWFNEFYINKGLNDGVYKDCNVLYDGGLLGIVTESYDSYARVMAIVDDRSKVTGSIGPSSALCTIEGSLTNYEQGYLLATDIDKEAKVSVGDRVITSNVSDRFLYGLTIGYVAEIIPDPNNLTVTARIKTAVDFSSVRDVLVITDRKQEVTY